MSTLIFATNNKNKVEEIRKLIGNLFEIITLEEAGIHIDIPEPHDTIEANAAEKSNFIYQLTGKNAFGEDTGLEIEALNNEPGVLSARYAGDEKNHQKNIEKVLTNLRGIENRRAHFKTIISLMLNGKNYMFEGICKGTITDEPKGQHGFGYDPIFIPEGSNKTFAEMNLDEKSIYSHRRKATDQLIAFLLN
ncbi:MAG: RdgB/HAM1 family non-canonical purine NTP pyrophosphatase [Chitinophagaceae bacterium]|nr:RdgB/HAM1 family non-canonical purine NTP pyrophosphatase [Chitinophagaceae bacterium]